MEKHIRICTGEIKTLDASGNTILVNSYKEFTVKNEDIVALMMFEEISGKNALTNASHNLTDTVIMLYALLSSCNDDFKYTFDEFKKMLQRDKAIITQYFEFLGEVGSEIVKKKDKK